MSEPRQPVILGGARTPVGRLLGSLASKSASELGGVAIAGALDRAGIGPEQVHYVIMGQVLQAGAGQITARQAAVAAGIPMTVPALTINKVCLSGLDAIALADQLITAGRVRRHRGGRHGVDDARAAPAAESRTGYKYGRSSCSTRWRYDGLTDAFDHCRWASPPRTAQRQARASPAQEQDEFAAASPPARGRPRPRTACSTTRSSPVAVAAASGGEPLLVTEDEGVRPDTTAEVAGQAAAGLRQGRHDHRRAPRRRSPTAPPPSS